MFVVIFGAPGGLSSPRLGTRRPSAALGSPRRSSATADTLGGLGGPRRSSATAAALGGLRRHSEAPHFPNTFLVIRFVSSAVRYEPAWAIAGRVCGVARLSKRRGAMAVATTWARLAS